MAHTVINLLPGDFSIPGLSLPKGAKKEVEVITKEMEAARDKGLLSISQGGATTETKVKDVATDLLFGAVAAEAYGFSKTALAANNWAALRRAADAANVIEAASGIPTYVRILPGKYNVDANIPYTGRMRLRAMPGTVQFINALGTRSVYVNQSGLAEGPHAISAIDLIVHPNVSGTDANSWTHRINVGTTNVLKYRVGDAVNIQSQNARTYYQVNIASYPVGTVNYAGESSKVAAVDNAGGYVYLEGPLILAPLLTTSPVMRRLSREGAHSHLYGIEFNTATDPLVEIGVTGAGVPTIDFVTANGTRLDQIHVLRTYHAGVNMSSCVRTSIDNYRIGYAPANADGRVGYGVAFSGAGYANVMRNSEGQICRHFVTVDGYETTAAYDPSQWWRYGDQRAAVFENCFSFGNAGSAFDTHEPSLDTTFINCWAVNARRPTEVGWAAPSSTPAICQLRGRRDAWIGGGCSGGVAGIYVLATAISHEVLAGLGGSAETKAGSITINSPVIDLPMINNNPYAAITIVGTADAALTVTNTINVDIINPNIKACSRAFTVSAGYRGRVRVQGGYVNSYDASADLAHLGEVSFVGTVFDSKNKRGSEAEINLSGSMTGVLELINTTHFPLANATPALIVNAASGVNATLRHAGVINALPTVTLALSGGAGTVTKVPLAALT